MVRTLDGVTGFLRGFLPATAVMRVDAGVGDAMVKWGRLVHWGVGGGVGRNATGKECVGLVGDSMVG